MMKQPLFPSIQTELAQVQKGDWFFPMTIKEINQHSLVDQALAKGALGFTFESGQEHLLPASALESVHLTVPALREHLFSLAREKRACLSTKIAVIAGSAGKTSVKEIVGSILKSADAEHSFVSPENKNTKIALATQVLRLPESCTRAVFEMGARKVNDFKTPLSYLEPSVVALLNIGTAHIGEFGSRENLWQEKLSCLHSSAQTLVIPGDDALICAEALKTQKALVSFGRGDLNQIQILNETADSLSLKVFGEFITFQCPFASAAKALNVAASVGVALSLGIPLGAIREGLALFTGVPRRFQSFDWDQVVAIDDAFNASPESLFEGLQEFKKLAGDKKVLVVLGSMLELDQESEKEHRKVAHLLKNMFPFSSDFSNLSIATVGADAELIGDELLKLDYPAAQWRHYTTSEEACELRKSHREYDFAYFKGSKSINLQKIFG